MSQQNAQDKIDEQDISSMFNNVRIDTQRDIINIERDNIKKQDLKNVASRIRNSVKDGYLLPHDGKAEK